MFQTPTPTTSTPEQGLTFPLRPQYKVLPPLSASLSASMSITDGCHNNTRHHNDRGMLKPKCLQSKMLLVLGLEGAMVHVVCGDDRGRSGHEQPHAVVKRMRSSGKQKATINVYYRPHIIHFITTVSQYFDIAIFSSGEQGYVDALLDVMDPSGQVFPKSRRYYRQHCTKVASRPTKLVESGENIDPRSATIHDAGPFNSASGNNVVSATPSTFLAKDLQLLDRPLNDVVLVDETPSSGALQPSNLLLIPTWEGDPSDTALLQLATHLYRMSTPQAAPCPPTHTWQLGD